MELEPVLKVSLLDTIPVVMQFLENFSENYVFYNETKRFKRKMRRFMQSQDSGSDGIERNPGDMMRWYNKLVEKEQIKEWRGKRGDVHSSGTD